MAYRNCDRLDYADSAGVTNACDDGLGFSLKPPKWLRNIVSGAIKGATITVPTPIGPQQIRVDDPNAMKQVRKAYTPNLIFGAPPPPPQQTAAIFGGSGLVLGVGAALLLVLLLKK